MHRSLFSSITFRFLITGLVKKSVIRQPLFMAILGIQCFASECYDTDDLMGSLYHTAVSDKQFSHNTIAILTRDQDLGQLLQWPQAYLSDCRHLTTK